jgi:hypothetical protein
VRRKRHPAHNATFFLGESRNIKRAKPFSCPIGVTPCNASARYCACPCVWHLHSGPNHTQHGRCYAKQRRCRKSKHALEQRTRGNAAEREPE